MRSTTAHEDPEAAARATGRPNRLGVERETQRYTRSVFNDGEYADLFHPDEQRNPFHRLYAAKRHEVLDIVRARQPRRVLDLGGGPGRMAVPLARQYAVTLADVSASMLELAASAAAREGIESAALRLVRLDASSPLPFATGTFDVAIAIDLLVHLANPEVTLRELCRVVTPGGRVLVDTTNSNALWMLRYPRYVGRNPRRWLDTWRAGGVLPEWTSGVTHHTRQQFERMLEEAGLYVIDRHAYGPPMARKWMLAVCQPSDAPTS
jgi:glycogen(starch) synthase